MHIRRYLLSILLSLAGNSAWGQHLDVLIQQVEDRLTTGHADFDIGQWTLGTRSYVGEFDSDYFVNDPGWNSLSSGSPVMPAGADALPGNTNLEWDFLPMKIDGTVANLFYWDGSGSVQFGALPGPSYELYLQSKSSGYFTVDGSPSLVTAAVIEQTESDGYIHEHRYWFLDDGDGDSGTNPADGIYLLSIRTRMEGLDRSRPFYFLFGTLGSTSTALSDAQSWVNARPDELAPDFSADFDGDLDIDSDDLLLWQAGYGTTGAGALQIVGDANYDNLVDSRDFLRWQRQNGSDLNSFAGTAPALVSAAAVVPEPTGLALLGISGIWLLLRSSRHAP